MKVLLAPDKFKGSLTSAAVARSLADGLSAQGVGSSSLALADGGDGSVAAALAAGFDPIAVTVTGPTGAPRQTTMAFDGRTALIEVADSCGLAALPRGVPAPLESSSRGLGDAVRAAAALRPDRIVLALGGSASTDGGAGLLAGLGIRFSGAGGALPRITGGTLGRIRSVDTRTLLDLGGIELVLAGDVRNPLLGADGAAAVYGPQKGASAQDIATLETGLANLVDRLRRHGFARAGELAEQPGAGSAGGLGFAGLLLGATFVSGADFFLDLLGFDQRLTGCDLVVTGEGRLDRQTLHGKLAAVVATRSRTVPVVAVVGRNDLTPAESASIGMTQVVALTDRTGRDPAGDPVLSARLLFDVGRTLPVGRLGRRGGTRTVGRAGTEIYPWAPDLGMATGVDGSVG